jgi:hypothetical protein
MVIAYSCAGEGFGHAARMAAMAPALGREHSIHCFAPPGIRSYIRERVPFARLHWIPCFSFVKKGNRVLQLASLRQSLALLVRFPAIVSRLMKRLRAIGAEGVLTDFDPFLAWAGRLSGLPVVQFNHPGIVQRYPSLRPRDLAGVACTRLMEGPFHKRIWTSFYGGTVGPILRPALTRGSASDAGFMLVNLAERLRPLVIPHIERSGLPYRVFPREGGDYDEALLACRAVVSTGGYQTASEALFLGKPLLLMPQEGQYEQRLNARMVEASGRGMACRIDRFGETFPVFLSRLGSFSGPLPRGFGLGEGREDALEAIEAAFASIAAAKALRTARSESSNKRGIGAKAFS